MNIAKIKAMIFSTEWGLAFFNACMAGLFTLLGLALINSLLSFDAGLFIQCSLCVFFAALAIHPVFYRLTKNKDWVVSRVLSFLFVGPLVAAIGVFLFLVILVLSKETGFQSSGINQLILIHSAAVAATAIISIPSGAIMSYVNFRIHDKNNLTAETIHEN